MPEHFYTGTSGHYPMGRDTSGLLLGAVEPGDVRDLDEAPDPAWLPVEGNEELLAPLLGRRQGPADGGSAETGTEDGDTPPADDSTPLPRRKRKDAGDGTGTPDTTTAGDSGSEES